MLNGHFSHPPTDLEDASAPSESCGGTDQSHYFPLAARPGNCETRDDATISPSGEPQPGSRERLAELVGIARLAASSPLAEAKRGTEYFLLPVRSIVNHCEPKHVPVQLDDQSVSRL